MTQLKGLLNRNESSYQLCTIVTLVSPSYSVFPSHRSASDLSDISSIEAPTQQTYYQQYGTGIQWCVCTLVEIDGSRKGIMNLHQSSSKFSRTPFVPGCFFVLSHLFYLLLWTFYSSLLVCFCPFSYSSTRIWSEKWGGNVIYSTFQDTGLLYLQNAHVVLVLYQLCGKSYDVSATVSSEQQWHIES